MTRTDQFRSAVLALAETHQLTAEEMVGMGLTLFASFMPVLIADPDARATAAHSMLDEALIELDHLMTTGAVN